MRARTVIVLCAGAVAAFGSAGYYYLGAAQNPPVALSAERSVAAMSHYTAVAKGRVDVDGGVIEVAARLGGTFREVLAEEGDRVEPGQVLAVQEDDEERIALRSAEASLESQKASLAGLEIGLEIAEREYRRLMPLVEIDAASRQELDRAQDELRRLKVDMRSRKAAIIQAEASLESARFRLEQRTIRAPLAGRIVEAKARPGVGASTLQVTSAFTLMPDAQRIVRADLDESFVGQVTIGQRATISPDARPDLAYEGEVIRIGEIFGRRTTQDGQRGGGASDHVIEVVIGAGDLPLLIGQRVLVRFHKEDDDASG